MPTNVQVDFNIGNNLKRNFHKKQKSQKQGKERLILKQMRNQKTETRRAKQK